MKDYLLECCVDSVESAVAAQKGGANRLELCGNLLIGGTTPDLHLYRMVRQYTDMKIHVLLRPRFGDFCYTQREFEILLADAQMFCQEGADGIVIGVLHPDGTLDRERMEQWMKPAKDMGRRVTLHRAFDLCRDPFEALETAGELGVDTILTSGQKNSCYEGRALLRQLREKAKGCPEILVGGGVSSQNLPQLLEAIGGSSFHMSGKKALESPMKFRRGDVNMGLPAASEYTLWQTDEEEIAKACQILREF